MIKKQLKRTIMYVMSAILTVGLFSFVSQHTAIKARAEGTAKNIQFGADTIIPTMKSVKEGYDWDVKSRVTEAPIVYYGTDTTKNWIVIGNNETGAVQMEDVLTLFANAAFYNELFDDKSPCNNSYANSKIKSVVDAYYDNENATNGLPLTLFSNKERSAIVERNLIHGEYSYRYSDFCDGVSDENGTSGYLWLLSTKEADLVGSNFRRRNNEFWLRSTGERDDRAPFVYSDGFVSFDGTYVYQYFGVRPAFNLSLSSIILASAAEGGKVSGMGESALMSVENYIGDEWKLTIHDASRDGLEVWRDGKTNIYSGGTIKVNYKDATTGENNYLSVILVDSNNNILSYGRIVELPEGASSDGVAYVTMPSNLTEGSTYTLKFMSEQYNGDKMTDFASKFESKREVSFTIGSNTYSSNGKAIQIGSEALGAGVYTGNPASLYYDSYLDKGTRKSDKWRVIGYNTDGVASADGRMTLLAESSLGNSYFDETKNSNEYSKSTLKTAIDNIVNNRLSTGSPERNAVINRTLLGGSGLYGADDYNDNYVSGSTVSDAVMWPLSFYEADLLNSNIRNKGECWWLRSPGQYYYTTAAVSNDGNIYEIGYNADNSYSVRPAIYLNLSSVIMTSAAVDGKKSVSVGIFGLTPIENYNGNEWKFTIHDSSRDALTVTREGDFKVNPGNKIKIKYSNAVTGSNNYLSAILVNSDNNIIRYGRLLDLGTSEASANGEFYVAIPSGLNEGTYKLRFLSEQYNGDKMTDFASKFDSSRDVTFTVGYNTYSNNGKAVQLGSESLGAGVNTKNAAKLYFDSYLENGTRKSDAWRVIGYQNDGVACDEERMTLLSDSLMKKCDFNYNNGTYNIYSGSNLQNEVNIIAARTTETEKEAIIKRNLEVESFDIANPICTCDGVAKYRVLNAIMWPLSSYEANLTNVDIRKKNYSWYLRSPGYTVEDQYTYNISYVEDTTGTVKDFGHSTAFSSYVRPAFFLNYSSIILTSAAEGGKVSGKTGSLALSPVGDYTGTEWKATLHDSSRDNLEVSREGNLNVPIGGTIKINYKNATTGENNFLSAIIVDSDGNILYYGRIAELSSEASKNGEAYIIVPSGLTEGSTYTLKFMSEQYNGDKMTDYASEFDSSREFSFTVGSYTYSGNGKTIQIGSEALGAAVNTSNAATLYYDSYEESGILKSDAWSIIGYNTNGVASTDGRMTLLAKSYLGNRTTFSVSGGNNKYSGSLLQNSIDSLSMRTAGVEKEAIIPRNLEVGIYSDSEPFCNGVSGTTVSNAYMWPLSTYEANITNYDIRNIYEIWWLRSPGEYSYYTSYVNNGALRFQGESATVYHRYVRPAFNLNLSSIIFTSAANGGKPTNTIGALALTPVGEYTGNEWKVTLHDSSRDTFTVSKIGNGNILPGSVCRFSYSNAKTKADTSKDEYVSAMLFDNQDNLLYYGRIVDLTGDSATGSGEAYVKIPNDLEENKEYTLKFFSEQYNGDKFTDLASDPDGAVITFTATATEDYFKVEVPSNRAYNGSALEATVTPKDDTIGTDDFEVIYFDKNGTELSGAPIDAGDYTFGIRVTENEYFCSAELRDDTNWKFRINKRTLKVEDFTIKYPSNLVYDGKAKGITVELIPGLTGIGNITPIYYQDNGVYGSIPPVYPGNYTFKLDVDNSGNNFEAATGLSDSNWKFTIDKATPKNSDFTVTPPDNYVFDGDFHDTRFNINEGIEGMGLITAYFIDSDKNKIQSIPTLPGTYKIELDVEEGDNYKSASGITSDAWTFTIYKATPTDKNIRVYLPSWDTYDGYEFVATVIDNEDYGTASVVYVDSNNHESTKPPVNVGTYKVKVNVSGGTIYNAADGITNDAWTFTIKKAIPNYNDFIINNLRDYIYDGEKKTVSASFNTRDDTLEGMGDISIEYYKEGETVPIDPVNAGRYRFKLFVEEGDNYEALVLEEDSYVFDINIINPSDKDFIVCLPSNTVYDGREKTATAKTKDGIIGMGSFKVLYVNQDGIVSAYAPTECGTYKVMLDVEEGENYRAARRATGDAITNDAWTFTIHKSSYDVTLNTNGGKINSGKITSYKYGVGATLPTDVTKAGYTFGGWYDNANCTGVQVKTISKTDIGDKIYYAKWTPIKYTVKASTDGNGTAKASVSSGVAGTDVTITATANDGFEFKEWKVVSGGVTLADSKSAKTTFKIGTADVEVKAIFEEIVVPPTTYTVKVSTDGNGTAKTSVSSGVAGTNVTITATANDGFEFKEWQVVSGGVKLSDSKNAKTTFKIGTANVEVKAIFEKETIDPPVPTVYTVTLSTDGNGTAFTTPESGTEGTKVTITATANEGYEFSEWQVVSGGISLDNNKNATTTFVIGTENVEVKAVFAEKTINPPTVYTVTLSTDGNGTATSSHESGIEGTEVTITAVANKGFKFSEWQVVSGGVSLENSKNATTTFTIGTENVEIKAIFETETIDPPAPEEFTVTLSTNGNGTAVSSVASGKEGD
ncbi:MAG: InlB B-repeat-containing protein [Lachnospiraceae bacterium]|nr:InlB B-repeat-containing protein [Lachnospiraceae bacterium]